MSVIPGKYIDGKGGELTVIGAAKHGTGGDAMVIYRAGDGGMRVLSEKEWDSLSFTYAAELELESYLSDGSRAELNKRIFDMFASRGGVYTLHWRSVIGTEGYNRACENQGSVPGCRRGVDSCKNCRSGWPEPFSEETVARHLKGEITAGVYPVLPDGTCRFLVFEPESMDCADALRAVCREYGVPVYCELIGRRSRLWIFFAEGIPLPHLRRLGRALVTLAMERSEAVSFGMYDRFIPCREEILPGDMGFELPLPFGKYGRDTGVFVDEEHRPLPNGPAELFRVRTVTRGYLADRLSILGGVGAGRFWSPSYREQTLPEGTALDIVFDGELAVRKEGLSHRAALMLRRLACVGEPDAPFGEFEPPSPCVAEAFSEDGDFLRLPRGLRQDIEYMAKASKCEIRLSEALPERENVYLSLCRPITEGQSEAAKALGGCREGILLAPLGWGKTGAAAKLIELKRRRTLIVVPDEASRERWVRNVMEYFGIDAERSGSKIHVLTAGDRHVKDKYGLVLLADCSRLPMDGEIFARLAELRPEFVYGITASDRRRDGRWGLIHMLCGPVVYSV